MKNIKKVFLYILQTCLLVLIFTQPALATGSGSALEEGKSIWNQSCTCPEEYNTVRRKRVNNEVLVFDEFYTKQGTSNGYCLYKSSDGVEAKIRCNTISAQSLMQRYIDNEVLDDNEAESFVREASYYATYVQEGLRTKTQKGVDLGDGPFNRAMYEFNQMTHYFYSFLIGFGFITSFLVFIMIFMKLTWIPDNSLLRRKSMEDIATSGGATIALGGLWLFVSLFQSIFDRFWSSYAVYSKDWRTVGNMFLYEYRGITTGILGVATLTALLMFIKEFTALSLTANNPSERKNKIVGILLIGLATLGLGGLTIFVTFFWRMIR